jgi:hypothetical protein
MRIICYWCILLFFSCAIVIGSAESKDKANYSYHLHSVSICTQSQNFYTKMESIVIL